MLTYIPNLIHTFSVDGLASYFIVKTIETLLHKPPQLLLFLPPNLYPYSTFASVFEKISPPNSTLWGHNIKRNATVSTPSLLCNYFCQHTSVLEILQILNDMSLRFVTMPLHQYMAKCYAFKFWNKSKFPIGCVLEESYSHPAWIRALISWLVFRMLSRSLPHIIPFISKRLLQVSTPRSVQDLWNQDSHIPTHAVDFSLM